MKEKSWKLLYTQLHTTSIKHVELVGLYLLGVSITELFVTLCNVLMCMPCTISRHNVDITSRLCDRVYHLYLLLVL